MSQYFNPDVEFYVPYRAPWNDPQDNFDNIRTLWPKEGHVNYDPKRELDARQRNAVALGRKQQRSGDVHPRTVLVTCGNKDASFETNRIAGHDFAPSIPTEPVNRIR